MRTSLFLAFGAVTLVTAAVLAACSSKTDEGTSMPTVAPTPTTTAAAPAAVPGALPGIGPVLETMDTGSYTYVRVNIGGTDVWAAGPQVAVKVGDSVRLPAGMAMTNYHSATLNRDFPLVYFVAAIQPGDDQVRSAEAMAVAHKTVVTKVAAAVAPVTRLDGGQSVEEIVTKSAELAGKDIAVRGRVVKFNAGIMGSNWIHIQDGTGAAGTNDLTVTTDATVAVGDVVVVRGKVTTDKDFGAGYKYAVIVEKAAVEKQ
ncbi:MAG: nucleotide-binding protein [Planctomycetes bacterium]|nr:nucleotide-binding protein [Planctomycetota bacterium]